MRLRLCLACLAALTVSVRAEIWQSPRWAVVGELGGSVGYDSNLTLGEDSPASAFLAAQPALVLRRHGSPTQLDVRLAGTFTHWFDATALQADGAAEVKYAYPKVDRTLPRFDGTLRWMRYTAGNSSLGRRVTADTADASFGGRIYSTGKLGLRSRVSFDRQDYSEDELNTNRRAAWTVGAAYAPDPNKELALNLVAATTASRPNRPDMLRVRGRELGLLLEGRGVLGPKFTGAVRAGAASARYRGAFGRSHILPVAGGEIRWDATVRSHLLVALDLGSDYSPMGEALVVQRATLAYEQTIRGPWRWRARATPAVTTYYEEQRTRRDRSIGGGITLLYDPSDRFDASLSYDFTTQSSDRRFAEFERALTTANLTFRF